MSGLLSIGGALGCHSRGYRVLLFSLGASGREFERRKMVRIRLAVEYLWEVGMEG